jgi:hypothetical protein
MKTKNTLSKYGTRGYMIVKYIIDNGPSTAKQINKFVFPNKLDLMGNPPSAYHSSTYATLVKSGMIVSSLKGYEVTHYGLSRFFTLESSDQFIKKAMDVGFENGFKSLSTSEKKIIQYLLTNKKATAQDLPSFDLVEGLIRKKLVGFDPISKYVLTPFCLRKISEQLI